MGEGELLAVARALTLALLASHCAAQGLVYRERWAYLHLEARRAEVWQALAGAEASARDRVADLLAAPDGGVPIAPVAKALAALRGVAADDAFVLRTAISAFVLPEVCDPQASNEICRSLNVSVALPFGVAFPAKVTFTVEALDAQQQVLWSTSLEHDTAERDVRMARPTAQIPCADLPDGSYRVRVATLVDGAPPRATDPGCAWTFHVLRGYQSRAEAAMAKAGELTPKLGAADRAHLLGLRGQVHRAYTGEAFAVASDGVHDLLRLEQALANVAAKRPARDGIAGDADVAFEVAGEPPFAAVLRAAASDGPRPLVVFVAGTPAYDPAATRPAAPATRDPRWLAHELAAFGAAERWHVAFCESPGLGRDWARDLRQVLPQLAELVATGGRKPLLVCEREAAAIAGLQIGSVREQLAGLVLLGGGAMSGAALAANGPLPVRYAAPRGVGEEAIERVLDYVAAQQQKGGWQGDVARLTAVRPPWPLAMPALADDIAAFARRVFAP